MMMKITVLHFILLALFCNTVSSAPRVTFISPDNGPEGGGTSVIIKGTELGVTALDLVSITVADVPCQSQNYVNSTMLTCVTGRVGTTYRGPVIVVTRLGGTGNSTIAYSYNLAPYISDGNPRDGPASGGTVVTIKGNSLGWNRIDILSASLANIPCTNIEFVSGLEIRCTSGVGVEGSRGLINVTTISGGSATRSDAFFSYNLLPRVVSVSPQSGPPAGDTIVTIYGENLGRNETDVVDIVIAGVSCVRRMTYFNSSFLQCVTGVYSKPQDPYTGEVYVVTLSGGNSQGLSTNPGYTFNAAPSVTSIIPPYGPTSGFTQVQINGLHLGFDMSDIIDVEIDGVSCYYSLRWINENTLTCVTAQSPVSEAGNVVVTTHSGGRSISFVYFTYQPACYIYTSEGKCNSNKCFWCSMSSTCLSDIVSCPIDCSSFSCASLVIITLMIAFIVLLIPTTYLVIRHANNDPEFKAMLRRFYKKLRGKNAESILGQD